MISENLKSSTAFALIWAIAVLVFAWILGKSIEE